MNAIQPQQHPEAHSQHARAQLAPLQAYDQDGYPLQQWVTYYEPTSTHDSPTRDEYDVKYDQSTNDDAGTGVEDVEDWRQTGTDVEDDENGCSWATNDALSAYGSTEGE
jgi:hypothetical protein